jgi:hypothetical protein
MSNLSDYEAEDLERSTERPGGLETHLCVGDLNEETQLGKECRPEVCGVP